MLKLILNPDICRSNLHRGSQPNISGIRRAVQEVSPGLGQKKGSCPAVELGILLRVVHPLVSKRLERYIQKLPSGCRKIEHYYHGTRLNCSIEKYLETCLSSECHVCGVTRKSFDASRIDRLAFQRLGPGFYLAPNSSKAHDYTNHSATGFRGIILCDVAPGKSTSPDTVTLLCAGPPMVTILFTESTS